MGIPFTAPQAEFEMIRDEWFQSVEQLAKRGVFVGGPAVTDFESVLASYTGVTGAAGVANGTDALFLALKALHIGPGDEVITAANTFIATVSAIHHTGARPVLSDCEPATGLINLEQAKALVTPKTKAIIPVHLFGQMVDLRELVPWTQDRGIAIVEDCAQAAGAFLDGKAVGSWGNLGCFSFYPDKNLGALGDAGAVTTSSTELLDKLRKLRNHGGEIRGRHDLPGFNSRLDPIQACALKLKLRYLDGWSRKRREIAGWYEAALDGIDGILPPQNIQDGSHVYHLYVTRVMHGRREELKKQLQKKGILTAVQYPVPVHLTPAFSYLGCKPGAFPVAEQLAQEILSLPMHIAMTEQLAASVADEIAAFLK